jgi:AcrR family transcriptional regulator
VSRKRDRPELIWARPEPARRPLDRARIVEAGIAVADEGGAGALTMAAVARRLGAYSAMALYRHVPDKDSLVDLMVDHVTAEVP